MSAIIRRGIRLSQPQYAVPLDPLHWLRKDIVFAYSAGRGPHDGAHGAGSMVGTVNFGGGEMGKNVKPADASSYLDFPNHDDYHTVGDVTVIAAIRTGTLTTQQAVVTKCETNGGSNTPFGLFTDNGGNICLNRANFGGGTPFRVWSSGNLLVANKNYVIAATQVTDISVPPKFYVDGVFDTSAAYNLYGGTVAFGPPTGNSTSIKIGNRTDLASRCLHDVYDALVIKRVLSDGEMAEVMRSLWAVWEPELEIMAYAVSAPTTFKAAWARNANSIITGAVR